MAFGMDSLKKYDGSLGRICVSGMDAKIASPGIAPKTSTSCDSSANRYHFQYALSCLFGKAKSLVCLSLPRKDNSHFPPSTPRKTWRAVFARPVTLRASITAISTSCFTASLYRRTASQRHQKKEKEVVT